MSKRKPCGRITKRGTGTGICTYERAPGKQRCKWHILAASSSDVQAEAAARRLEMRREADGQYIHHKAIPKQDWPAGERWCAGCQSFVPLFYCQGSRCKGCTLRSAHAKRVEAVYGISEDDWNAIWERQGKRCAICRRKPASKRFATDHDHKTDEVRGILCKRCNHDLLGGAHDSIEMLFRAIQYLLRPPASEAGARNPLTNRDSTLQLLKEHLILQEAIRSKPPTSSVDYGAPPF